MELRIEIDADDDSDDDERANAAAQLRRELRDGEIDTADVDAGPAPAGTKAGMAQLATTFMATVSAGVSVDLMVDVARDWLARHKKKKVVITGPNGQKITVPDVSIEDAKVLLEHWAVQATG